MIGIVIVAHGGLACEYFKAIEHVVGAQRSVRAIRIEADHNRTETEAEICRAAEEVDTGDGVVLVTDLFGGSPYNLSLSACKNKNRRILYGANLPMLIKLAKCRHRSVSDASRAALEAGKKYMDSQNISSD